MNHLAFNDDHLSKARRIWESAFMIVRKVEDLRWIAAQLDDLTALLRLHGLELAANRIDEAQIFIQLVAATSEPAEFSIERDREFELGFLLPG
jgi:hypothetical protein